MVSEVGGISEYGLFAADDHDAELQSGADEPFAWWEPTGLLGPVTLGRETAAQSDEGRLFEFVNGREKYNGPIPPGGGMIPNPNSFGSPLGVKMMVVDEEGFVIGHQG